MTTLTLDSKILLEAVQDLPSKSIDGLKRSLTLKNPEYLTRSHLKLPTFGTPREIKLYEMMRKSAGDALILHRGALLMALSEIRKHGGRVSVRDNRLLKSTVPFSPCFRLRPYQKPILEAARSQEQGLAIAPAGSGKTQMGMAVIADIGQPALWLTHTQDLLDQAKDRAVECLGLKPGEWGIVGAGERTIGTHITFGMVQTIANFDSQTLQEFGQNFGTVIVDEAHRAAAGIKEMTQMERVISFMPARYRFGLTASEHRSDGLMESVYHIIGPKFFEVDRDEIPDFLVAPTIQFIDTNFSFVWQQRSAKDRYPYATMLSQMGQDAPRNLLILQALSREGPGHYNLVLGDSLAHLAYLLEYISEYLGDKYRYGFLHGGTARKERKRIIDDMRAGKIHFLFATYALVKEGLDIPRLDRLYLATPKKDKTVIEQSIGRVARPFEGKQDAIVLDFWDPFLPISVTHARARIKDVYEPQKCKIIGGPRTRRRGANTVLDTLAKAFDE